MKKLIIINLLSLIAITGHASAATHSINTTIDHIEHIDNRYVAVTTDDWSFDITPGDTLNSGDKVALNVDDQDSPNTEDWYVIGYDQR